MNVYQIITDRILSLLEKGVVPWHQPWRSSCNGDECGAFFNLKSKRAYRGVNTFLLAAAGYDSPYWASFNQIKAMGGAVKAGEKATQVIFWKQIQIKDGEGDRKSIPFLQYYNVFNVAAQTTGLEHKLPKSTLVERKNNERRADCEELVENMPKRPGIDHGSSKACYSPATDRVRMPDLEVFESRDAYYSVLFHELVHSTGHESRLAREFGKFHGDEGYAKEELIAEMGAAFLCGHLGIESRFDESASYLQWWISAIKEDPKLIVSAASKAQKAADFILGKFEVEESEKTTEQKD